MQASLQASVAATMTALTTLHLTCYITRMTLEASFCVILTHTCRQEMLSAILTFACHSQTLLHDG